MVSTETQADQRQDYLRCLKAARSVLIPVHEQALGKLDVLFVRSSLILPILAALLDPPLHIVHGDKCLRAHAAIKLLLTLQCLESLLLEVSLRLLQHVLVLLVRHTIFAHDDLV